MNRKIVAFAAIAALGLSSVPGTLTAQAPTPAAAPSFSSTSAGPTVSSSAVGIRRAPAANAAVPAADARMGAGRNVALMVVGGAALIIGAVIGGTAGVLIAVTGAAIGLYGLYNFIQ